MKTQMIMPMTFTNKRQVAFGDGSMPNAFGHYEAMERLKNKGYIIKGSDNKDAFGKLYDDVNDSFEAMVRSKKGVYSENYSPSWNNEPDFVVHKWDVQRDKFVNVLSKFWEKNKHSKINDVDSAVTNFLVNTEGLQKPGFFQRFSSRFAEYVHLESILEDVTKMFIKTGKHNLK